MADRLPWLRGNRPNHFIATMLDGTAEIFLQDAGRGVSGWRYRLVCGATVNTGTGNDKQHVADQATEFWSNTVRQERVRLAKVKEARQLEEKIDAAYRAGHVDVMSFGLSTSTYDRLIEINEVLRHKNMLEGPLKPLAQAVSAELYRRRMAGRPSS